MSRMEKGLETERLLLRKLTIADVEAMHRILSDPVTMQFWPKPFDLEGSRRWVQRSIDAYEQTHLGRFAIILKEDGRLAGDCGFMRSEVNGVQENDLGYILGKEFWGKGFATEAAAACLKYGITVLGLKRIVASMATHHLASKRVAEKIGLKLEREFINSRNRDLPTFLLSWDKD
jgi:ribosomal-protein-alanine N-acetyltransferase